MRREKLLTRSHAGLLTTIYGVVEMSPIARLLQVEVVQATRARARGVREMDAGTVMHLVEAVSHAGVPSHLVGGWGVDALVGHQTRLHDDLDLAYESCPGTGSTLESVLSECGYRRISIEDVTHALFPVRILFSDGHGRSIDLLPFRPFDPGVSFEVPDAPGRAELPTIERRAFVTGSLRRGSTRMTVSCLGVQQQLASRVSYEPRRSDKHDVARLLRHVTASAEQRRRSGGPMVSRPGAGG